MQPDPNGSPLQTHGLPSGRRLHGASFGPLGCHVHGMKARKCGAWAGQQVVDLQEGGGHACTLVYMFWDPNLRYSLPTPRALNSHKNVRVHTGAASRRAQSSLIRDALARMPPQRPDRRAEQLRLVTTAWSRSASSGARADHTTPFYWASSNIEAGDSDLASPAQATRPGDHGPTPRRWRPGRRPR
eukprot:364850-Chlamydomonas_euryale.AAC.8